MSTRLPSNVRHVARRAQNYIENSDKARAWLIGGTFAVGVGILTFALIRKWVKARKEANSATQATNDYVEQVKQEAKTDPTKAQTLTDTEAELISQSMYNAMEGFGTDETTILKEFAKMKSKGDWAAVLKQFGMKEYGTFGKPAYSYLPSTPTDLKGWLYNECSTATMKQIEAKWNEWGVV